MKICIKNGILPKGGVRLPPSKSEAVRAALLLGMCHADPARAVEGFPGMPICDDVKRAIDASYWIECSGTDVGDSASLMRMILPIKLFFGRAELTGSERVLERGVKEYEECFGASTRVRGNRLIMKLDPDMLYEKRRFEIDCSRSSQFLSGLLIALPGRIGHDCEIVIRNGLVSKPYADMTVSMVKSFGGLVDETEPGYTVHPSLYSAPERIPVAGDQSCAAVFRAMNHLGGSVEIEGLSDDTLQPDSAFSTLVGLAGCDVTNCPDLMPLLAACACAKTGDTVIRGTARLRDKESDREAGIVSMINSLGGSAEVSDNAVVIHGTGGLKGGVCSALGDHRLAFAAAVMAMISVSPVILDGAESVRKSAPGFWEDLERIGYGLDRK